jgi:hypothetical protein
MREHEAADLCETALSPADEGIIDALFAASLDAERIGEPDSPERDRARRAARLLALLTSDSRPHASLADVTLARVLKVRREQGVQAAEPVLSIEDQAAVDAWVMSGFTADGVAHAFRERARRLDALAATLVAGPADPGLDTLADKTMARVQMEIDDQAGRLQIEVRPRRRGLRLADIASVAAVLLIGSGVLRPSLNSVRDQSQRAHCMANLGSTAMAFGAYAGAYREVLPVVSASLGGGKWWEVGQPQHSNSANLYALVHAGYTGIDSLACPGNPAAVTAVATPDARDWRTLDEVSYSYQIMFGRAQPRWNDARRTVVLADRSPVVLRSVRNQTIDPFANAPNHRSRGEHLLWNDGSAQWVRSPVLKSGDNIWLNHASEHAANLIGGKPLGPLQGTETPDSADDVCLGP